MKKQYMTWFCVLVSGFDLHHIQFSKRGHCKPYFERLILVLQAMSVCPMVHERRFVDDGDDHQQAANRRKKYTNLS
jgi:hypothetical protein